MNRYRPRWAYTRRLPFVALRLLGFHFHGLPGGSPQRAQSGHPRRLGTISHSTPSSPFSSPRASRRKEPGLTIRRCRPGPQTVFGIQGARAFFSYQVDRERGRAVGAVDRTISAHSEYTARRPLDFLSIREVCCSRSREKREPYRGAFPWSRRGRSPDSVHAKCVRVGLCPLRRTLIAPCERATSPSSGVELQARGGSRGSHIRPS